jgi:ketosteroid isomerase-like protein
VAIRPRYRLAVSALALGRQMIEGWSDGRLDAVFATFDENVVVRTDPTWPEQIWFGRDGAERFWHSVRQAMGPGQVSVEEEHDLGDRALWRVCQPVSSPSGVRSAFSYSFLVAARAGSVIMVEFFIDDAALRAELGIPPGPGGRAASPS